MTATTPLEITLSIMNSILAVFGSAANLLVCIVIYKNEELQNGLDLLIANLCFADLSVCIIAQPMYVAFLNGQLSAEIENAFSYFSLIAMHAVALNLLAIAVNRMLAIAHPFTNTLMVSKFKVLMVICAIWISAICVAVFLFTKPGKVFSPYSHVMLILTFLLCYARIFFIARKQRRQIHMQMQSVSHNHQTVRLQKANRANITSALIVLSLMVCFFPDTVYDFLPTEIMEVRKKWLFTMLFLSCSVNPCIYMWRTEVFKVAMKRTLGISPSIPNQT